MLCGFMGSSMVTHLLCIIKNYNSGEVFTTLIAYIQEWVLVGLHFHLLGSPTCRQVARDPHVLVVETPVEIQEID